MSSLTCQGSLSDIIPRLSAAEAPVTEDVNPLIHATYENTPSFSLEGVHLCKILDIYDGDTFTVALELPGIGIRRFSCRILGIDTAEMKYSVREPMRVQLKDLAYRARNRVAQEVVDLPADFYNQLQMKRKVLRQICGEQGRLIELEFSNTMDKFGRCLVNVPIGNTNLTQILIDEGLALPYQGGTKTSIHELLTD